MSRDYKDVFNDAYEDAIDAGHDEAKAGELANDAVGDYYADLIDDAMNRRDEMK